MGASSAPGIPNQYTGGSFYGNEAAPKLITRAEGRRTIPNLSTRC